MLELKSLEDIPYNFPPFKIKNDLLNILSNNSDKNLDLICDSILWKEIFIKIMNKKFQMLSINLPPLV